MDDRETAARWYREASETDPDRLAVASLGLGSIALRDGNYELALEKLTLAITNEANERRVLNAQRFMAEAHLRLGHLDQAQKELERLIREADEIRAEDVAFLARTYYGKSLMLEPGKSAMAIRYFREAVARVESGGMGLDAMEGIGFLRERSEPYAELASALATEDGRAHADEILDVLENAHARSLRRVLREQTDEIPQSTQLAYLRQNIPHGSLLLDFLIGEDRGTVLAVGHAELKIATLPGWSELREPIRRYRIALRRPLISSEAAQDPERDLRRDIERGKKLRRLLLGPVQDLVDKAERIYIVPDQDLALLPFAALPLEESGSADDARPLRFLGEVVETAVLPMAGVPPKWPAGGGMVLLAGDPLPDPSGEFSALPLAGEELDRLQAIWGDGNWVELERGDLSATKLLELDLDSFDTLHFATHAVASSLDPRRCAVILSGGEKLGMQQISEMSLGPSMVVLSACQTGEGEVIPGEGVVGLSWAFLKAGAKGITASLWNVEDSSTADLMVAFHRNLEAGHDPVRSMAQAQRELSATNAHPAFWAPFIVILRPQTGS